MVRWVHIVAVFVMAALIANSQCDARCLASLCQTTSTKRADGCHHSSSSSKDGNSGCQHRQSNLAAVEASPDLAKIPVAALPTIAVYLPACIFPAGLCQGHPQPLERGSPPGRSSVLRI
jgi:hypothetical protein